MAAAADGRGGRVAPRLEWWVLADATLAGLAALIPLPGLDLLAEAVFRRRIPRTIASRRGARLHPVVVRELGRGGDWLTLEGCLLLPFRLALWLVKKVFRKLVYVLTVAEATTQVSEYWHRAYLVDHLVRSGRLAPGRDPWPALAAFRQVLEEVDASPLTGLARQVVASPREVVRALRRARRGRAGDDELGFLESRWALIQGSLEEAADRLEARLAAATAAPPGPPPSPQAEADVG